MEQKNQEAFQMLHNLFTSNNIKIPEIVNEKIVAAFEENDFDGELDDPINIYFRANENDFIEDVKTSTTIDIELGKLSSGTIFSHYNYYGNTKVSYSEQILLENNGQIIEEISNIPEKAKTSFNVNDWAVLVIEEVSFLDGELSRIPRLYIYCPEQESGE